MWLSCVFSPGCGGGDAESEKSEDSSLLVSDGAESDVVDSDADVSIPSQDVGADLSSGSDTTTAPDSTDISSEPPFQLELTPTVAAAPVDLLAESGTESCGVYLEEQCVEGTLERCEIYDTKTSSFDDDPNPLLRRVYLYDRWHDLYGSPDDQTAERVFKGPMPGEAPESEWSAPENFSFYAGKGDSAIWTGASLSSDIFRYLQTGTTADYARMETGVRSLLTRFDVTGIPGYLARYHFLLLPPGTPDTGEHFLRFDAPENLTARENPIESLDFEGVPDVYLNGVPGADGNLVKGTPMWKGHPSIDQYTGPMMTFPVVFNLLKDETLKARITEHITCYLKRLRRLEVINLQDNPDVMELITQYFGGSVLNLDSDDRDPRDLEKVVAYYHAGINSANTEDFDRSCPDTVATEPVQVLDATDPAFYLDMLALVGDMDDEGKPADPGQIDHVYVPNVRGGDASHMIHLAAMAYYFTGDEQYRDFLSDVLIDELHADEVALGMQAFRTPPWCYAYYGDHITYGTHWQLISMLGDSPLRDTMLRAMQEELWEKGLRTHHSSKFNVMYGGVMPPSMAPERDHAIAMAVQQLEAFGGNDGVMDAPRRTYSLEAAEVMAQFPEGTELRCPTAEERAQCEMGVSFMGVQLEAEIITAECTGAVYECVMDDGLCARGIASDGLPPNLRGYADFMWQRSPYKLGDAYSVEGYKQSPGRDLTEAYWMARYYGFITQDPGQVLAWRDSGTCESP